MADCCEEPIIENIPGTKGDPGTNGTNGTDGENARTLTTDAFVQPAVGSNVTIDVESSDWVASDQNVWVEFGGDYKVISLPSATSIEIQNLGYADNAPPTTNIPTGSKVTPSGQKGADGSASGGDLLAANNLSELTNIVTARSNLGLGTAAVKVSGTGNGQAPVVDDGAGLTNGEVMFATASGIESKTASATRTALGLVIGTNVQAQDGLLSNIAALVTAADKLPYFTVGVDAVAMADFTSYARTLLDDATATAARETLGKVLPRYGVLAIKTGIDANVANNDNAITVDATRYRIDAIMVENASNNLTLSTVGIFTAAGGGGTTLAADQVLTALTASTKYVDLTLGGTVGTDVFTAGTIYARTGTAQGAPATFDLYVLGWKLDA